MYYYVTFPVILGRELEVGRNSIKEELSPSFSSLFTYTSEFPEIEEKWIFLALAAKIGASLIKSIP